MTDDEAQGSRPGRDHQIDGLVGILFPQESFQHRFLFGSAETIGINVLREQVDALGGAPEISPPGRP